MPPTNVVIHDPPFASHVVFVVYWHPVPAEVLQYAAESSSAVMVSPS